MSEKSSKSEDFTVNVETLFPVFLCTSTLAVAWSALLWQPVSVVDPSGPWAMLEFGFFGAYAFAISMLVRRFYQSDLRPSAYATVVLRIILVLLIVIVLHQLFAATAIESPVSNQAEMVVAFVVGFFPLIGLQALQRAAAKVLHVFVPQLAPDYPLDQLDGLNVWYEARLVEEGVEDMQNLTTMNLVDVILHTRAPVGRLIDWVDQAFLLIHLDRADRDELAAARKATGSGNPRTGAATRVALRRVGVRSATDLLKTFGPDSAASPGMNGRGLRPESLRACGLDPDQLNLLVGLVRAERGLDPVWNWKNGGASCLRTPSVPSSPEVLVSSVRSTFQWFRMSSVMASVIGVEPPTTWNCRAAVKGESRTSSRTRATSSREMEPPPIDSPRVTLPVAGELVRLPGRTTVQSRSRPRRSASACALARR